MTSRKNAANSRGKPFEPGNPGKPKGARHKTTLLAEKLMQADAAAIVKAVLDSAKGGDITAAQIVLERLMPAPRDSKFDKLAKAAEDAVLQALADGKLAVSDAGDLLRIASEVSKNPLYKLPDAQRRAVVVELGLIRGEPFDHLLAEVGLTDGKYDEAQNCVSRETWDQIDAYYGHSRPNNCTK